MKQKVNFLTLLLTVVMLLNALPVMAAIPQPFRIGGTVTLDGVLQPATVPNLTITVTKADGTVYQSNTGVVPTATYVISAGKLFYRIDIPMFDATDQPQGANSGDVGLLHVSTGGGAYTISSPATPAAGNFAVGAAGGSNTSLNLAASSPLTAPGSVSAVAGSNQATVTFTTPTSNGGSTITGYTVTSIPAGGTDLDAGTTSLSHNVTGLANGTPYTFTVTATNQAGATATSSASASVTPKANQTISFGTAPIIAFGTNGTVSATATSSLPVSYSSLTTGVCTVASDGTVTPVTAGSCTIAADQSGNAAFNPAPQNTQNFTIAKATQTVNFSALAAKTYGNADFGPGATATSGLAVTYSSGNTAVATITAGGLIHIVGAGSAVITATQAGDARYQSATAQQTLTVNKAAITVTASNASRAFNTANPTFAVTYTGFVNGETAGAVLTGAPVTTTTAILSSPTGSYPITVTQGTLAAANYSFIFVAGTLAVDLASQNITFAALPVKTYGDAEFTLSATGGGSGNPVTFSSSNPSVAELTNGQVKIKAAGTATITASQAGDSNYSSATAQQVLTVNKANLTVTADNASRVYGTANPTLTVQYSGFVNGETQAVLSGSPVITTSAVTNSTVGSYPITATLGTLSAANYSFTFVPGTLAVGVASQTIDFTALPAKTYGDAAFTLAATGGGSNNPIVFTSSNSAVATISGNTVTIVGAGSATITANQAASTNYASATAQQTLTVAKAPLSVTTSATRAYGVSNPTFAPSYTGFVNNETAAVLQGAPTLTSTADLTTIPGSYTISVTVGNLFSNNYSFNFVDGALTITKADQTITFNPAGVTFGATPTTLSANATSSLPVTFSVTSGPGSLAGTVLSYTGAGTITVVATQAGDGNYNAAQVTKTIAVAKATQSIGTISFNPASLTFGGTAVVSAVPGASSSPVVFSSKTTSICTVTNGSTVNTVAAGVCTIAANQAADANYNAATEATQNITVAKASQAISFGALPTVVVDGTGQVSATGGATNNSIAFTSKTPTVCTVTGSTVTGKTAGLCTVAANQAGNGNYNAATEVTQDITIGKGSQTISFGAAPSVVKDGTGTIVVTGGASTSPVVLTSNTPSVCTVSGTTVTGVAVGSCTIAANQAADANYNAAAEKTQNFQVTLLNVTVGVPSATLVKAGQSVTFPVTYTGATNVTLANGDVQLNATGSATGSIAVTGAGTSQRTVTVSNVSGDGTIGITIKANTAVSGPNQAGASAASATFEVDSTSPVLSVNTLANNTSTSNNTLTVAGTVTDKNLLSLTVNGTTVPVANGSFSYADTLQSGANIVTVVASDAAGNQSSNVRTIIYDTTAPAITLISPTPADQSVTAQESAIISGSIDTAGTVTVTVNGNTPVAATMNGTSFSAPITLALGANTIVVTAADTAVSDTGAPAPNTSTVQRIVTFDNTKPAVAIVDPSQDITTTMGNYLVKGTVADQYTTVTLDFKLDGVSVSPAPVVTTGSFEQNVALSVGKTYAISVRATDAAGNFTDVTRNIVYRPLGIADAVRALQIAVGLATPATQDAVLDVAPVVNGVPTPNGFINAADVSVILRKTVGELSW